MLKYFLGLLKYFFQRGISIFSLIDYKSRICNKVKINYGVKVFDSFIDSYSYVGSKSQIVYSDIGRFCSISQNCTIGLASHSIKNISTSPIFTARNNGTGYSWTQENSFQEIQRVTIGNDVWIGTQVIIMGGIKIGNGAIIGAGSIVTKNIPDYAIAVGVPAKVIKYRFDTPTIEKLLVMKWWQLSEEELKENLKIFQIENFILKDLEKIKPKY